MESLEPQTEPPSSGSHSRAVDSHVPPPGGPSDGPIALGPEDRLRVRAMFDSHYDPVWRFLRRLGLDAASADDGAQQVFIVAIRRLADIDPEKQRSFLFGTASRVASSMRKRVQRRREDEAIEEPPASSGRSSPDELVDKKRKRQLLDQLLAEMEDDLREVLVLAEMEDLGKREIAEVLGIAEGTAASRLRRAREDFNARLKRAVAAGRAR